MINKMQNMKQNISGVLLLDKPEGLTSNQVLQKVKYLFNAKKAGHTGSLDPNATGMLAICLGEATKFSQFLLEADKRYQVVGKLGEITPSGDSETEVTERRSIEQITVERIEQALEQFRGEIWQVPPMYSAIKVQGSPLYKLARKGVMVERTPRKITMHQLELLSYQDGLMTLDMYCSKGTYVRTIVTDLGEVLGCGAYVTKLRRLSVGPYRADQMITLEHLTAILHDEPQEFQRLLLPIESMLMNLPSVVVTPAMQYYLRQGNSVLAAQVPSQGLVRLVNRSDELVGVGQVLADGKIAPCKLVRG